MAENADPVNVTFARVMYVMSIFSIAVIIISGIAYFMGFRQYISIPTVEQHWNELAESFWKNVKGYRVEGYSWFLGNLGYSDSVCVFGIALLATVPFVSLAAVIAKSDKYYKIIFTVLIVEFVLAVLLR